MLAVYGPFFFRRQSRQFSSSFFFWASVRAGPEEEGETRQGGEGRAPPRSGETACAPGA
jgi:hypothetical protein